jgi:hypothetical protein
LVYSLDGNWKWAVRIETHGRDVEGGSAQKSHCGWEKTPLYKNIRAATMAPWLRLDSSSSCLQSCYLLASTQVASFWTWLCSKNLIASVNSFLNHLLQLFQNNIMPTISINRDLLFKALGRSYSELILISYYCIYENSFVQLYFLNDLLYLIN